MEILGPNEPDVSHQNLLDFHQLRKLVFADELAWDVFTCAEIYEFDQYDVPAARYVVAYADGACVGGARLLPCNLSFTGIDRKTYTYMLNDFCFGALQGQFPAEKLCSELPLNKSAWEMTRFVAKSRDVTKMLLKAVDRYLAERGVSEVITISPIHMPRILKRLGYEVDVISAPVIYDDRAYVALSTKVSSFLQGVKSSAAS